MFESIRSAANGMREAKRRLASLPAALAVHAMAVALVMAGQLWAIQPVVDPETPVVFVEFEPPSPPPAPPDPVAGHEPTPAEQQAPRETTQIHEIPSTVPTAGSPAAPSGSDTVTGGDPNGKGGGIPGGAGNAPPPPPPPPPPEASTVYTLATVTTAPRATYQPAPTYPELARRARIEGTVLIRAVVNPAGEVVDVRLVNGPGMGCSEAALDAVRSWRYEPATLNGRHVAVQLEIRVTFRLNWGS